MDILTDSRQVRRLEIVETGRRRRWSAAEKLRIVEESFSGPRLVSATARHHGLSKQLLFSWRKAYREWPTRDRGSQRRCRGFATDHARAGDTTVIPIPTGVRVWLATGHTDMRCGFPSLALRVQEVLKRDAMGGGLFCFRGKRGDLLKVIWHDGQGACLFTKRLERGRFIWPSVAGESVTISPAQLSYLLSGIDCRNPQETQRPTRVG